MGRTHPWFKGLWGPVPMPKGALACRASPSHALALRTAVKGCRPLASSAAIADASVQPAPMQRTHPSGMVFSGVCMRRVAAMLLSQVCCSDPILTVQKKYQMHNEQTLAHVGMHVCWTTDRLFFDFHHSKP